MVRTLIVFLAFLLSGCTQSKEAETTSQLQVKLEAIIVCDWTEPKAGMVGELEWLLFEDDMIVDIKNIGRIKLTSLEKSLQESPWKISLVVTEEQKTLVQGLKSNGKFTLWL